MQVVVFDKTGTLTLGEHRVVAVRAMDSMAESEALRLAAALERDSEHPVARAVVASANDRGLAIPKVLEFQGYSGLRGRGSARRAGPGGGRPQPAYQVRGGPTTGAGRLHRDRRGQGSGRDLSPRGRRGHRGLCRSRRDPARGAGGRPPAPRARHRGRHADRRLAGRGHDCRPGAWHRHGLRPGPA